MEQSIPDISWSSDFLENGEINTNILEQRSYDSEVNILADTFKLVVEDYLKLMRAIKSQQELNRRNNQPTNNRMSGNAIKQLLLLDTSLKINEVLQLLRYGNINEETLIRINNIIIFSFTNMTDYSNFPSASARSKVENSNYLIIYDLLNQMRVNMGIVIQNLNVRNNNNNIDNLNEIRQGIEEATEPRPLESRISDLERNTNVDVEEVREYLGVNELEERVANLERARENANLIREAQNNINVAPLVNEIVPELVKGGIPDVDSLSNFSFELGPDFNILGSRISNLIPTFGLKNIAKLITAGVVISGGYFCFKYLYDYMTYDIMYVISQNQTLKNSVDIITNSWGLDNVTMEIQENGDVSITNLELEQGAIIDVNGNITYYNLVNNGGGIYNWVKSSYENMKGYLGSVFETIKNWGKYGVESAIGFTSWVALKAANASVSVGLDIVKSNTGLFVGIIGLITAIVYFKSK